MTPSWSVLLRSPMCHPPLTAYSDVSLPLKIMCLLTSATESVEDWNNLVQVTCRCPREDSMEWPVTTSWQWRHHTDGRCAQARYHAWLQTVSATARQQSGCVYFSVSIPGPVFSFSGIREWPFSFPGFPGAREWCLLSYYWRNGAMKSRTTDSRLYHFLRER